MKRKKSLKIFWVRIFYRENEKEREILETLSWIFTFSYNTTTTFLYIANMKNQFRKGMNITVFIKNKIIFIRRFTLHSFLCSLF